VDQSSARFDRGDFPTITRTNAKTIVQVKSGEEVLVGGLVQENSAPNEIIVPFLGEIPLIKHFFRRKNNQSTSLELVILLTPRILDIRSSVDYTKGRLEDQDRLRQEKK